MFNIRRWMLRPRYEMLEAGPNPLDDDALMQREKRSKRKSLWRWFLFGWVVALGFSIWWMVARPGDVTTANSETAATLIPAVGGAGLRSTTTEPAAMGKTATPTETPTTPPTPTPTPTKTPLLNDFWGGGNDTILTITPFGQKPDTTPTPTPTGTPPALIGTATAGATVAPARFGETPTPIVIIQNRTTTVRVEVTRQVVEVTRIVYVEITATPGAASSAPGPRFYHYLPMVWR